MILSASVCALALLVPAPRDGSTVTYKGFVNQPLGQACLTVDANDRLIVSDIGASGQDGVGIDFDTPFELELDLPDAAAGTDGAFLELTTIGTVNGLPDQVLQIARIEDLGNVYGLMIDVSALASTNASFSALEYDVEYRGPTYSPPPAPSHVVAEFPAGRIRLNTTQAFGTGVFNLYRFDPWTALMFPDGPAVSGNICVLRWAASGGPNTADSAERFELRASGFSTITIEDEDTVQDCISPAPRIYCTAKSSSSGCLASISYDTEIGCKAESGEGDWPVLVSEVQGFKNGLLFFGFGNSAAIPFQGGTLCVQPPLARGTINNSAGSSPLSCDGTLFQIINDGGPWDPGPGSTVWTQAWYRDPLNGAGGLGTGLSNAMEIWFF